MEPAEIKYEYNGAGGIPSAVLKPGEMGVITTMTFYNGKDHIRGEGINIGMDLLFVQQALRHMPRPGLHNDHIPTTLEECTDAHLEALSKQPLGWNGTLPLEELRQLKVLEHYLRDTIGDYRSRR